MVEKKEKTPEELVKDASDMLIVLKEVYKRFGYKMMKKHSGTRVLEKLLFNDLFEVNLVGQHEQELFDIGQRVLYNKVIVQEYVQKNGIDKLKQILEENNGKEENG